MSASVKTFELKKLSNDELDQTLQQFVKKEREVLSEILIHIAEIDRRKLYLTFAYPSLFEYLTKHIGYSAGSAQRRIDAARLAKEVPEVIAKLEEGSINLSQVGFLQKSIRLSQSETKSKVSIEDKKDLITEICGKSFAESQVLVSQTLNIQIKEQPKITHQQNESIRFEVTLTKSQWNKLTKMRELLSNSVPTGSWDQVLEYLADKVTTQKSPKVVTTDSPTNSVVNSAKINNSKVQKVRMHLAKNIRDQILKRDECCQYMDKRTERICGSKWQLHIDHIHPVWAGGENDIQNLRVLCANHNLEVYRTHAGISRF